ncbi:MAG TPA: SRPBCC domain-containing protein [Anaerolineales bacterium]|nr:SRPBCC domain-containing protein [Anaerolineales bacterium]HLE05370.1 SRPBCC domain-containing protein [Anaerolineales bacterium]
MDQLEERQIEVSRTFESPLELLWKAWTEPEHFMKWYGPKGFTAPTCEIDLREGGRHLWSMLSPDGRQMYYTGSYKEVVLMERLVFSDGMSDAEGNLIGMGEGMPESWDVTVTFVHADGKTTVTVSHVGYGASAEHARMGWEQAIDKLTAVLAKV